MPDNVNKKHGLKCFHDLFEIKNTEFFSILDIPLAKHSDSETGISFSNTDLAQTKFMLYGFSFFLTYRFHGNID